MILVHTDVGPRRFPLVLGWMSVGTVYIFCLYMLFYILFIVHILFDSNMPVRKLYIFYWQKLCIRNCKYLMISITEIPSQNNLTFYWSMRQRLATTIVLLDIEFEGRGCFLDDQWFFFLYLQECKNWGWREGV